MSADRRGGAKTPALEWIAAAIGLLFLVTLLGIIGAEALTANSDEPPAISIEMGAAKRAGKTYVAAFKAVNRGGGTAAALEIEGKLIDGEREVETSHATIDYLSSHGSAAGGLIFTRDPAGLKIVARPLGYQTP